MEGSVLQTNICWVGVYCFIDGKNLQTMIEGKDFRSHEKASSQKLIFDKTVVQISKKITLIFIVKLQTHQPQQRVLKLLLSLKSMQTRKPEFLAFMFRTLTLTCPSQVFWYVFGPHVQIGHSLVLCWTSQTFECYNAKQLNFKVFNFQNTKIPTVVNMIMKKKLIFTVCVRPELYHTKSFRYGNRAVKKSPGARVTGFVLLWHLAPSFFQLNAADMG